MSSPDSASRSAAAVVDARDVAPEDAWRYAIGGPDEHLTGTITTSCIARVTAVHRHNFSPLHHVPS